MRAPLLAAAVGFALSGCQTASLDIAIQKNLPKACQALETAHAAFMSIVAIGTVKRSVINKEAAAYIGVRSLCVDPERETAADVLAQVVQAYATIDIALNVARQAQ
ncbi:cell wall anchor protein [Rhizobium sp. CB3171]|uniref:cell wall anchor protein n=1 Tax=Rhizobium sp. CB3171 TaxID=3039157 RepID=UPI0024B11D57|nr:cell wall anchor protein [Rhizobium sp. CB3171]WFU03940.1 cell wall anchor protein [Rhizobium sp. CB3171]